MHRSSSTIAPGSPCEAVLRAASLKNDIDREFDGHDATGLLRASAPFLRVGLDDGGRVLVLRADPTAEP